ncbi:MAG: hypothetical protein IKS49_02190 [Actinomycetaceae bacterium]|nr:hypothetical protein [Actinomycetaceae bacterium]
MNTRGKLCAVLAGFTIVASMACAFDAPNAHAANSEQTQNMYRMYNRISGEHLYTADTRERDILARGDWNYEGVGWVAPQESSTPVYRLYNRGLGDHHYTTDANEVEVLTSKNGWKSEGIGWYSSDSREVSVWRQYNPRLRVGAHNYTTDLNEYNVNNSRNGWQGENVAWYAIQKGWSDTSGSSNLSTTATYILNKNSNIIHPANDKHVKKMSDKNKVFITSQSELNNWLNQGARFCQDQY